MPVPIPPPTPPGLYVTSQDIIKGALRLINVLGTGEQLDADEGQDALVILNEMIDSWQAQRLKVFSEERQVFPLTAGKQVYTIGIDPIGATTADFNVPRPARIDHMGVLQINSTPQPIELPIDYLTDTQWADIPVKNVTSSLPQVCYDDGDYPFRNLNFWPIPNTVVDTVIYSWQPLNQFVDLGSTKYAFPPGYWLAIRYSLAEYLAPEYGAAAIAAAMAIKERAADARAIIESINAPVIDLRVDAGLMNNDQGLYNWISDTPVRR